MSGATAADVAAMLAGFIGLVSDVEHNRRPRVRFSPPVESLRRKNRIARNGSAIFESTQPSPPFAVDSPIHGRMFLCYSFRKEN
jgi:hypothetical protein